MYPPYIKESIIPYHIKI